MVINTKTNKVYPMSKITKIDQINMLEDNITLILKK